MWFAAICGKQPEARNPESDISLPNFSASDRVIATCEACLLLVIFARPETEGDSRNMFKLSNIFPSRSDARSALNKGADSSEYERRMVELCAVSAQEAIEALNSTPRGLSPEEAERRLNEYGANELAHAKKLGFWGDIFRRCKSPLVVQLLVIAALAGFIGEAKSAVIVGAMVVLSVGLSYILDRRSSRAVETLGKRVQSRALVLRNGEESEIKISDVVPGDIVLLQAGSVVPADVRLLVTKDFS